LFAPLFLTALGIFGDLLATPAANSDSLHLLGYISLSGLKNIHLAYASIDIWALTEFITAAASKRLQASQTWAYVLAATIGLLFHVFAYLAIAIFGSTALGIGLGVILLLIGTVGVVQIRVVVFQRIEIEDLAEMDGALGPKQNDCSTPPPSPCL
jgi:fatty acid desaturase